MFDFEDDDDPLSCECMDRTYVGIETEHPDFKGYHVKTCNECGNKWFYETIDGKL